MAAAEPGTVWEGYTLAAHLRDLGPGAIVSLEVRYVAPPRPGPPRRRRRTREPEPLERLPGQAAQSVEWVSFYDHGIQTTPSTSLVLIRGQPGHDRDVLAVVDLEPHALRARGGVGLIRQLERSRGGAGAFFDRLAQELGHDDLGAAHRFKVYLLGYEGEPGVWPAT